MKRRDIENPDIQINTDGIGTLIVRLASLLYDASDTTAMQAILKL